MKDKIKNLPQLPGCYLMKDADGQVLYVGKAKNIRNRVKSYFTSKLNTKTQSLMTQVVELDYLLTNSEQESLILEFNLIKKYLPKYNIRLIDDKSYPYIEITQEENPKLVVSRYIKIPPKATLFGPYPNSSAAYQTVKILQKIYPLRRCDTKAKEPCLYSAINLCIAHLPNKEKLYQEHIKHITRFLKGDNKGVLSLLEEKMDEAANALEFEKALEYRDLVQSIKLTTQKQIVAFQNFNNRDFISFVANEDDVSINILMMREGRIIDHHHTVFQYVDAPEIDAINYLRVYYDQVLIPDELIFDQTFDLATLNLVFSGTKVFVPLKGNKKKLVELSKTNAQKTLDEHHRLFRLKHESTQAALDELSIITNTKVNQIEVFDNAHIFGTAPIAGMIFYEDGRLNPKKYRKFHLKTTTNDDYQAMKEIIYRRYYRKLLEGDQMCDLICVDGSKGQVNAALEVLNALNIKIPVLGLKKNQKHQLDGYVFNNQVVLLDRKSNLYQLLVKLSEEVHRFSISFHQSSKTKTDFKSVLDDIKGLGKQRKALLLHHFSSIDQIKEATIEQLVSIGIPMVVATNIKETLNHESNH